MEWLAYLGLTALAVCWIPQSIDTIKQGRCPVNLGFLILSLFGSVILAVYAWSLGNHVFTILNTLTTLGAAINFLYKLFPRARSKETA
jgi:MtN3 and saliva related transmembrane protein